jgi:hypothetical protein
MVSDDGSQQKKKRKIKTTGDLKEIRKMKKILGLVLAVMVMVGVFGKGNTQEKTMTDVNMINDYAYEVSYSNGEKERFEFDNELDAVEEYTDVWYEIYGDEEEEITMTDVKTVDKNSIVVSYSNGEEEKITYDSELECAEEYSNVWYDIHEM